MPDSFADPARTFEVNLFGTLNLLSALKAFGFAGRMVYVSSGDVYGMVEEDCLPIREDLFPRPRNPYAVSKLAAEALCYQWSVTEGLDVVIARPFNHIGPGQSERFAVSGFAKQVAEIAAGRRPAEIEAGDLDVTRDFCDVRDVIAAYGCLFASGRRGAVYNVASGVERTLRDILKSLQDMAGVTAAVVPAAARFRPAEQRRVCASVARIKQDTGWSPAVPFDESLRTVLRHWENHK